MWLARMRRRLGQSRSHRCCCSIGFSCSAWSCARLLESLPAVLDRMTTTCRLQKPPGTLACCRKRCRSRRPRAVLCGGESYQELVRLVSRLVSTHGWLRRWCSNEHCVDVMQGVSAQRCVITVSSAVLRPSDGSDAPDNDISSAAVSSLSALFARKKHQGALSSATLSVCPR